MVRVFPWAFALAAFASRVFLRPQRDSASVAVGLPERIRSGPLWDCPVPLVPVATWEDALFTPGPVVVTQRRKIALHCHLSLTAPGPSRRLRTIGAGQLSRGLIEGSLAFVLQVFSLPCGR